MSKCAVIDSDRDMDFPEHRMYAVAYTPAWQKIRTTGSFTSVENARRTIAQLERYITMSSGEEKKYRVWRVSNYMNSVPIGQPSPNGLFRVPKNAEDDIVAYRVKAVELLKEVTKPVSWDWHYTRVELASMLSNPIEVDWLRRHSQILRVSRANKSRNQPKPELHYYLSLIQEVVND